MLTIHKDSHLDHGLSPAIVDYLTIRFADRAGFFKETIELPPELGELPCALVGPLTSGKPIAEIDVIYIARGSRSWASRVLSDQHAQKPTTRLLTVIAGPYDGQPCVLFTAYAGPQAPREPGDPSIASWDELLAARGFWADHALIWAHTPSALPEAA